MILKILYHIYIICASCIIIPCIFSPVNQFSLSFIELYLKNPKIAILFQKKSKLALNLVLSHFKIPDIYFIIFKSYNILFSFNFYS